jgi:tyrosinase
MGVRKNIRSLTAMEMQRFVSALIQLKASGTYDTYVAAHMNAMHHAHRGPAFLPWHREFLRRLERDLQGIDPSVTIPYWDWTTDNTTTSLPWHVELLGGDGRPSDRQVTDGPFARSGGHWPIDVDAPPDFLRREMGVRAASLPSSAEVATVLAVTPYDSAPWDTSPVNSFRNQLEGWRGPNIHNRVHVWVGGSMYPMSSPNDPVFFLHHCNIDRLWAQWQATHPTEGYQPVAGGPSGHNLNDPMDPWGGTTTVAGVLDHRALGYTYDVEVTKPGFADLPIPKAIKDPHVNIKKLVDDPKPITDVPVKKAIDEPHINIKKITDDPKAPHLDIPKLPGDVKAAGFDEPFDPASVAGLPGQPPQVPFALATPHHSAAWAGAQAPGNAAAVASLSQMLAQRTAELETLAAQHRALLAASQAGSQGDG